LKIAWREYGDLADKSFRRNCHIDRHSQIESSSSTYLRLNVATTSDEFLEWLKAYIT